MNLDSSITFKIREADVYIDMDKLPEGLIMVIKNGLIMGFEKEDFFNALEEKYFKIHGTKIGDL